MWSMILLMSRLPGGRSMSAGRQPEKLGYQQSAGRHYQEICADRTQRSATGCRSATRVKGPRYLDASPWATLYVCRMSDNSDYNLLRLSLVQQPAAELHRHPI